MGILSRLFGRKPAAKAGPSRYVPPTRRGASPTREFGEAAKRREEAEAEGARAHGGGEVEDFLGGEFLFVATPSDTLAGAQYFADTQTLHIEYKDGTAWAYDPIGPGQAESFIGAVHKMTWLWDNVRVRGTRHQHQCNARQVR